MNLEEHLICDQTLNFINFDNLNQFEQKIFELFKSNLDNIRAADLSYLKNGDIPQLDKVYDLDKNPEVISLKSQIPDLEQQNEEMVRIIDENKQTHSNLIQCIASLEETFADSLKFGDTEREYSERKLVDIEKRLEEYKKLMQYKSKFENIELYARLFGLKDLSVNTNNNPSCANELLLQSDDQVSRDILNHSLPLTVNVGETEYNIKLT